MPLKQTKPNQTKSNSTFQTVRRKYEERGRLLRVYKQISLAATETPTSPSNSTSPFGFQNQLSSTAVSRIQNYLF